MLTLIIQIIYSFEDQKKKTEVTKDNPLPYALYFQFHFYFISLDFLCYKLYT